MKTTRRHELQTNQLAESLARWIDAAKPYSRAGLAVIVAAVVLVFAWGYMAAQANRRNEDAWQQYLDAFNSRDSINILQNTSEQYSGTPAAQWARLVLADIQLDQGTNHLFTDKKEARSELRQAAEKYQSVLIESREPMMSQHATYGLARAHEALGELAKARDDYNSIVKQWPDSAYAPAAEKRAKDLDQQSTKQFYDWFAQYTPPQPMSKQPGIPGVRPDFLKDPLDDNGPKVQSVIDGKAPGAGPALPSTETPATDAPAPVTEEKPASDAPADEKPADEKPSDEKPADAGPSVLNP